MTTEDDFQGALDTNPDDWQTRLVFADWLDERGDPRAVGYRALGALQRVPHWYSSTREWGFDSEDTSTPHDGDELPQDWFDRMPLPDPRGSTWGTTVRVSPSRRAIEDSAALGFVNLPDSRRAELLATPGPLQTQRGRKR